MLPLVIYPCIRSDALIQLNTIVIRYKNAVRSGNMFASRWFEQQWRRKLTEELFRVGGGVRDREQIRFQIRRANHC
jgi:hypothetical protein